MLAKSGEVEAEQRGKMGPNQGGMGLLARWGVCAVGLLCLEEGEVLAMVGWVQSEGVVGCGTGLHICIAGVNIECIGFDNEEELLSGGAWLSGGPGSSPEAGCQLQVVEECWNVPCATDGWA